MSTQKSNGHHLPGADDLKAFAASAVRVARRAADLSQTELAAECRLSRASISNIEAGKQAMTVETLVAIARECGVEPCELLPGRHQDNASAVVRSLREEIGQLRGALRDIRRAVNGVRHG